MKFDKDVLIGIAACALLLMFWNPLMRFFGVQPNRPAPPSATEETAPTPARLENTSDARLTVKPVAEPEAATPAPKTAPAVELPSVRLADRQLALVIAPGRGVAESITFELYKQDSHDFRTPAADAAITLAEQNAFEIRIGDFTRVAARATSDGGDDVIAVSRWKNPQGAELEVTQKWQLRQNYVVDYRLTIANPTKQPVAPGTLHVDVGSMSPWSSISGDKVRTESLNIGYYTVQDEFKEIDADDSDEDFRKISDLRFAALNNKYFTLALKADRPFAFTPTHRQIAKKEFVIGGSAEFNLPPALAPQSAVEINLGYYAGPKETGLLEAFCPAAGDLVQLSWGPLNYLAKLLLWILDAFHRLGCSYGWSIILLTLLVRTLFFPITMKANNSMRKMQQLQPKIKALREQYKDNPQIQNVKMMELYRAEKINPLGGCLPILLQIPVFFALYSTLDNALQLRHVAFWWSRNLAGPDTVASWALPFSVFGISHFNLNPLVIAMTVLMIIQQHLTPTTMEPMQKRMMQIMPIVMLFLLYELPSGLTLYWTVSNIFSIFQMLWQNRLNRQHGQQSTAKA